MFVPGNYLLDHSYALPYEKPTEIAIVAVTLTDDADEGKTCC